MPEEDAFMGKSKVQKSYREINERIRRGKAVVVTAEEMIDIVRDAATWRRRGTWMW